MPALRKTAKITGRRDEATKLYLEGLSLRGVAAQLNCSHETARADIIESLKTYGDESRELLQEQKRAEFCELKMKWREPALTGDVAAATLYLKVLAAESKLFGLDADAIGGVQSTQTVVTILPQYADLVRPLLEAQEQRR